MALFFLLLIDGGKLGEVDCGTKIRTNKRALPNLFTCLLRIFLWKNLHWTPWWSIVGEKGNACFKKLLSYTQFKCDNYCERWYRWHCTVDILLELLLSLVASFSVRIQFTKAFPFIFCFLFCEYCTTQNYFLWWVVLHISQTWGY